MKVVVVGAGRAGTAIAVLLRRAGHTIAAVNGRDATAERAATHLPGVAVLGPGDELPPADVVLIGVPDDRLADTVAALATGIEPGTVVAHLSGASGLRVLTPAIEAGARGLAIHPLQTFADVDGAIAALPGTVMAVTATDPAARAVGETIANDLGARPVMVAEGDRATYHAAAVFASNDLVAITSVGEELLRAAGFQDPGGALDPLQRATLDNVRRLGPDEALTGPAVRGDAGTIEANLVAISATAPGAVALYVAACRVSLDIATRAGRLPPSSRTAVEEVLRRWS